MAEEASDRAAAYLPFGAFKNSLDRLAKEGMPTKIDKSVFVGQSGGMQNQLIAGYKFLELVADDKRPTKALERLAITDEAQRKKAFEEILRNRYKAAFELDLGRTTSDELNECFSKSFGVDGSTKQKAVRFFLNAVTYIGIPLSSFLKKAANGPTGSGPRRQRGRPKKQSDQDTAQNSNNGGPASGGGESRTIKLNSGGTATFSVSTSFFELSDDERTFVFTMLDAMKEQGKKFVEPVSDETVDDEDGDES